MAANYSHNLEVAQACSAQEGVVRVLVAAAVAAALDLAAAEAVVVVALVEEKVENAEVDEAGKKIIYIADTEILAIPIKECGEPLVNIKNTGDLAYGPPPENEFTKDDYTKLRETVYKKLLEAENNLPNGLRFRLYEGYRSLKVQQLLFDEMFDHMKAPHPNDSYEDVFHETTRLVSPVNNLDGSKNIPAHNSGGAVDIEIMDENGLLIDMGMESKDWLEVEPDLCNRHCQKISDTAKNNRMMLLEIMESHGFINYPTEWWHFSYGDRYWAYQTSSPHALYGPAG